MSKKPLILTALAAVMSLPAMASTFDLPAENLRVSSRVAHNTALSFESGEFTAHTNGTSRKIDALDVRCLPEDLQEAQLKGFLSQGGYLQINPLGEDDYSLEARIKALGGSSRQGQSTNSYPNDSKKPTYDQGKGYNPQGAQPGKPKASVIDLTGPGTGNKNNHNLI